MMGVFSKVRETAAAAQANHRLERENRAAADRERIKQNLAAASGIAAAAWYTDPSNAAFERYWDGRQWTDQTRMAPPRVGPPAPVAGLAAARRPTPFSGVVLAGWLVFLVGIAFPPLFVVSFVLGAIAAAQSRAGSGVTIMILSVIGPIFTIAGCAAILSGS